MDGCGRRSPMPSPRTTTFASAPTNNTNRLCFMCTRCGNIAVSRAGELAKQCKPRATGDTPMRRHVNGKHPRKGWRRPVAEWILPILAAVSPLLASARDFAAELRSHFGSSPLPWLRFRPWLGWRAWAYPQPPRLRCAVPMLLCAAAHVGEPRHGCHGVLRRGPSRRGRWTCTRCCWTPPTSRWCRTPLTECCT